ncbi:GIY-YIG nuclease family protein [Vibrio artabrorum]|uniref:GIY-YIG nuclease family protein n=1 Tax=Vibrio artabrorum TaxID=446374 RepID=UPI0021C3A217|nr:GIY-YIG nuclease family protein [Vibrio artabrorum]
MNRLITLTEERLTKAKTPKGGYSKAQLQVLGVNWPPTGGWKKRLIGKKVTLYRFIEFVRASRNKSYLNEIETLLPTLVPPVDYLERNKSVAKTQITHKKNLSKKELKRERTAEKKANLALERESKIRTYGIQLCINALFEKADKTLHYVEKQFLHSLSQQNGSLIPSSEVSRLYRTMKKHGLVLTRANSGNITLSGFTMASKIQRAQLLYVIRQSGTNYCKIGISKDPKKRLRDMQTSSPTKLKLSLVFETKKNAIKLEKSLHKAFHKQRANGEWFLDISDEKVIETIADRGTVKKVL